jgi:citrate lyase beta subunit
LIDGSQEGPLVRYFSTLHPARVAALFHRPPREFLRDSPADRLAIGLGATLYAPAVRPRLADDIGRCHRVGVMSMVCCLEDAIRDDEVFAAEDNLAVQLRRYAAAGPDGPLVFVRVRTADQIRRMADRLGDDLFAVSGFVLPKFRADDEGLDRIEAVRKAGADAGLPMYAMPVLETPEVAAAESRLGVLRAMHQLFDAYRESILAIRVGGTDLSGLYGLRRPADVSAWHISVLAAVLGDIVNVFGRCDGSGFPVTGPVWEHFSRSGLAQEVRLDRANGLSGKTVIHPDHAVTVNALSVVSHEEYLDAEDIAAGAGGGVLRSEYRNKMNEVGPHRSWAERTLRRAEIFGVAAAGVTSADLIQAVDVA